jgi:hypothetical protein
MHWEWKNCPTAYQGQYTTGKEETKTSQHLFWKLLLFKIFTYGMHFSVFLVLVH